MADEQEFGGIWKRLGLHGEQLARHDAEIDALQASTARLESLVSEVRGELRETRTELKSEMGRGFDRLAGGIDRLSEQTLRAYSPEAAAEIGSTRAAEGRARAYALSLLAGLLVAAGVIAALIVR